MKNVKDPEEVRMMTLQASENSKIINNYEINSSLIQFHSKEIGIFVFGKPKNWRSSFKNHPELIQILREKNIKKVYIPKVSTFTGKLALEKDFCKDNEIEGIEIVNGFDAEGLVLPQSTAVFLTTADGYTVTCHNPIDKTLIVFHAGLRSLVDRMSIIRGVSSRPNESVVDDLMKYVKKPGQYDIFINCGVSSTFFCYDLRNPSYGETNMKILTYLIKNYKEAVPHGLEHGGISIKNILIEQFLRHGFKRGKIYDEDGIDTGKDDRFWSHSRSFLLGQKECGRNGILVMHK